MVQQQNAAGVPSTLVATQQSNLPTLTPSGDLNLFNPAVLKNLEELSSKISQSILIPAHFQKKPADCFIALYRAVRAGVDPFAWMEQTYVVHGKLGMQAQLVIALLNSSGLFETNVQWRITGDESDITKMAATAIVVRKDTKIECTGYCSYAIAEAEGWVSRNPKWNTMTRMMLQYRSATFLGRTHCPEIMLGIKTVDEIQDVEETTVAPDGQRVQQLFTRPQEAAQEAPISVVDAEVSPAEDKEPEPTATREGEAVAPIQDSGVMTQQKSEEVPADPVCEKTGITYKAMREELLRKLSINTPQMREKLAAYLVSIKWLNEGELFESLQDMYVERIHTGLANFNLRFCKFISDKEKKNGGKA